MTKYELKQKYRKFLLEQGKYFDKEALNFINNYFFEFIDDYEAPDILLQIYSEIGLLDHKENRYKEYLKIISNNFDICKNILEVGGGFIPSFANLLSHKQLELGCGTVTVYDPNLINLSSKFDNVKLIKEPVDSNTLVDNYDLIIGIMPCGVTETILELACKNQKDFFIALCGCSHFNFLDGMAYGHGSYRKYILKYARELLNKYNNGVLIEDVLDSKFSIDYPIIYNKKS